MYTILKINRGRDAIRYIIRNFNITCLHIPYYLCDVVRHTIVEEGCKPLFYHINDDFYPDSSFEKSDYVLYPNYWGVCGRNVKKLAGIYPNLIVDNAHAFYDEPSGFACFNVGHKFGYNNSCLWIKNNLKEYSIPHVINYNKDIVIRKERFSKLYTKYKSTNLLNIDPDSVPFVYPFLAKSIDEADELVKNLKKEGKIIYRYWSPLPKSFNEYKFYSRLVPIPILPH